jgi:serine protease Do
VNAGVVVTGVEPGGVAEQSGLQAGDVILAATGKPVKTSSDLKGALGSRDPKDGILLQVLSGGARHFIVLREKA